MSNTSKKIEIKTADETLVSSLADELDLKHFIAETLVARGISSVEEARDFLIPSLERDWNSPYIIENMDAAVNRIESAIRNSERILVFGDFDLDGISATTVMTRGLRALGADVVPFIPKRFEEGYGLSKAAIERARTYQPSLIVTVDCGISGRVEAELIADADIDLVVTDHHEYGDLVPRDVPVVDPKGDDACPSNILAGVGVALKTIEALGERFDQPELWREYTDLATLGTIADMMSLTGENRALVADGLKRMNSETRPCIAALADVCDAKRPFTSTGLSYSLIPRLNAAGRMNEADVALDVLMSDDYNTATEHARKLEALNEQRRAIEAEIAASAEQIAGETYNGERVLVVAGEGWHEGVKGIVASRLVNKYGVPTFLFSIEDGVASGSGRSAGSVNLFAAVEGVADILTRFGGHSSAVGVTLPADKLDEFRKRVCEYMDTLDEDSFSTVLSVDAVVEPSELTISAVSSLDRLAPFGQDNPSPRYLIRNVHMRNARAVGADKTHFSCELFDDTAALKAIYFSADNIDTLVSYQGAVDVVCSVQVEEWRGRRSVKCMVESIVATETDSVGDSITADDNAEQTRTWYRATERWDGWYVEIGRTTATTSEFQDVPQSWEGNFVAGPYTTAAEAESKAEWLAARLVCQPGTLTCDAVAQSKPME